MKFFVLLALFLATSSTVLAFTTTRRFIVPCTNPMISPSIRSVRTARNARGGMLAMKVQPPSRKNEENERLRTLEQDSERWFQEQQRREANGELGWLENPAFYTAVFFLCPLVILVGGAATGVIPGFVPNTYEYSTMEEVKSSFSYGDLTQAAEYASGASSLF
ncbi:Hypothetical protein NocV09_00204610 [Nannochloropsis oceanica]